MFKQGPSQVALQGLFNAGGRSGTPFRNKEQNALTLLVLTMLASLQLYVARTYWVDGVTRCGVAEGGLDLAVLMSVLAYLTFGKVPPRAVPRNAYM